MRARQQMQSKYQKFKGQGLKSLSGDEFSSFLKIKKWLPRLSQPAGIEEFLTSSLRRFFSNIERRELRLKIRVTEEDQADKAIQEFELENGTEAIIGRSSKCLIRLDNPRVSSVHAGIRINEDGEIVVRDFGSTNGTYRNEMQLDANQSAVVRPEDIIHVASALISCSIASHAKPATSIQIGVIKIGQKSLRNFFADRREYNIIARLRFTQQDITALIEIDRELLTAVFDELAGVGSSMAGRSEQPSEIERGMIRYVIAKALDSINADAAMGGSSCQLQSIEWTPPEVGWNKTGEEIYLWSDFEIAINQTRGLIEIGIPRSRWEALPTFWRKTVAGTDYGGLSLESAYCGARLIEIAVRIGWTELDFIEWDSLKHRDILLIEHTEAFLNNQGVMEGSVAIAANPDDYKGGIKARCLSSDHKFNFEIFEIEKGAWEAMPSSADQEQRKTSINALSKFESIEEETRPVNPDIAGNVKLELVIELGRIRLPLKDVIRLQTGQILELNKDPCGPVDILNANRRIASGQLIMIDDRLAIEISEIHEKGG
jgi:flagellar motor switch protein FliN